MLRKEFLFKNFNWHKVSKFDIWKEGILLSKIENI